MVVKKDRKKRLLAVLMTVMAALWAYRLMTPEMPRTQPLLYPRGTKVSAPVREGVSPAGLARDPLSRFLARSVEKYPGVERDLFHARASGDDRRPKPVLVTKPVVTVQTAVTPTVLEKTPEEIAREKARIDLLSFRFLGVVVTDKGSSLFLSKDGELFIAKSGDNLLETYRIKDVGRDYVVLQDAVTKVEVRVELTGSGDSKGR
ncbi:MAG: hypothetical protein OEW15_07120 [Nitrospirota bacterium]|nr:hypothetical protein [Nitrospirota bacterium]